MKGLRRSRPRSDDDSAELQAPGPDEIALPRRPRRGLTALVGVVLMVVAAGGWLVADALAAVEDPEPLGGNVPVNAGAIDLRDISAHNSPTLAQNPTDSANLVVANRIDTPRFSCALHVSNDGGATFGQTPIPVPEGEQPKCYAPDVAFSPDGTMYLSYVTLFGRGNVPHAVWITSSDDGGQTLTEPVRALGELSFQVRLLADPEVEDRIYITWLDAAEVSLYRFATTGNPVMFASSDDGGQTWSSPVQVSSAERERVVAPASAIGPDGSMYVAYLDLLEDRLDYEGAHEGLGGPPYPGKWQLVVAASSDAGRTWDETVVDALTPTERFIAFIPPFPSVAAAQDGRVYVAFHDGRRGDPDVYLWSSSDGGATFSDAVRVNDTAARDGTSQYLPKLSVAPNGRLDVLYYDRRADADDVMTEASLQSSYDAGDTFTARVVLTDQAFDSTIGFGSERDMPDLGSRLALLSTDDKAMAVWTDTRAGTHASNKQDLVRALVALSAPPGLTPAQRDAIHLGAIAVGLAGAVLLLWSAAAWARGLRRPPPAAEQPAA